MARGLDHEHLATGFEPARATDLARLFVGGVVLGDQRERFDAGEHGQIADGTS